MDRCRERHQDLEQSIMTICDGDAMMMDFIMNSSVSMYLTKLEYWVEMHKKTGNGNPPPADPKKIKRTM